MLKRTLPKIAALTLGLALIGSGTALAGEDPEPVQCGDPIITLPGDPEPEPEPEQCGDPIITVD